MNFQQLVSTQLRQHMSVAVHDARQNSKFSQSEKLIGFARNKCIMGIMDTTKVSLVDNLANVLT